MNRKAILLFPLACNLCAQQILFNEDFESLTPPALPTDWFGVFRVGNSGFPVSHVGDTSQQGLIQFESVSSGNPGNALQIDANLNFLSWAPNDNPEAWLQTFFDDENPPTTFVGDDEHLYFQFDFDLLTSETQPVGMFFSFTWPDVGSEGTFGGGSFTLTNDLANVWQSHSITYRVFERWISPISGPHPQLINQNVELSVFRLIILSEDWGTDVGNVLRLDNLQIRIVPEISTNSAALICLIIMIKRIAKRRNQRSA